MIFFVKGILHVTCKIIQTFDFFIFYLFCLLTTSYKDFKCDIFNFFKNQENVIFPKINA